MTLARKKAICNALLPRRGTKKSVRIDRCNKAVPSLSFSMQQCGSSWKKKKYSYRSRVQCSSHDLNRGFSLPPLLLPFLPRPPLLLQMSDEIERDRIMVTRLKNPIQISTSGLEELLPFGRARAAQATVARTAQPPSSLPPLPPTALIIHCECIIIGPLFCNARPRNERARKKCQASREGRVHPAEVFYRVVRCGQNIPRPNKNMEKHSN